MRIESFKIEWDSDYGIAHRRGWSAVVNGVVVAELTWLPVAACRAACYAIRTIVLRNNPSL